MAHSRDIQFAFCLIFQKHLSWAFLAQECFLPALVMSNHNHSLYLTHSKLVLDESRELILCVQFIMRNEKYPNCRYSSRNISFILFTFQSILPCHVNCLLNSYKDLCTTDCGYIIVKIIR